MNNLLVEATGVVREQAYHLRQALEQDNLREILKYSAALISELRTSQLSPKDYYDLYVQVFQELQKVGSFFADRTRHRRKFSELYETVQHAGNILPRLYLLITVGAKYIESGDMRPGEIIEDIIELCKGVQNPVRGLFLRYYLNQMTKSFYRGKDIENLLPYLLQNFIESNRLWCRMQYFGTSKNLKVREEERNEIKILISAHFVGLAQIDGLEEEVYKNSILPKLLEHIESCKDVMAQQYLLDCLIQVFPEDWQMQTMKEILDCCCKVEPQVDLKQILGTLMSRLADSVKSGKKPELAENLVCLLKTHLEQIVEKTLLHEDGASSNSLLDLLTSFLKFSVTLYPERKNYVEDTLITARKLSCRKTSEILKISFETFNFESFKIEAWRDLFSDLDSGQKHEVSREIVKSVSENNLEIDSCELLDDLASFLEPLLSSENSLKDEEALCYLSHSICFKNSEKAFELLTSWRKYLSSGGKEKLRLTLIPVVHLALELAERLQLEELKGEAPFSCKKVLQFVHKTCTAYGSLVDQVYQFHVFRVWLQAASTCDILSLRAKNLEPIMYEFTSQALISLTEILDSERQMKALYLLCGKMNQFHSLDPENYDNIATKLVSIASKQLRKTDQCRAVLLCSHLFFDTRRVECLRKSLILADICLQTDFKNLDLLLEILSVYVVYFEQKDERITSEQISSLIFVILEHLDSEEEDTTYLRIWLHNVVLDLGDEFAFFLHDGRIRRPEETGT